MDRLLYLKFSNERDKRFSIYTLIKEDTNGNRFVEKHPIEDAGKTHIDNLLTINSELEKLYKNTEVYINQVRKIENGVRFEYLNGKTYEGIVDESLSINGKEYALETIKAYIDVIIPTKNLIPFNKTEEFVKVFGDVVLGDDNKSLIVSDIDLVMSNLIVGDKNTIIDYEWTFDFPIPIDYIKYRIIHYYVATSSKREVLNNDETYKYFGISMDSIEKFKLMERNFQKYVEGKDKPFRDIISDISPGINERYGNIDVLSDYERTAVGKILFYKKNRILISQKKYTMPNGNLSLAINIPSNTKKIIVKPSEYVGICRVKKILLDKNKVKYKAIHGEKIEGDLFIFQKSCPAIEIYLGWHKYSMLEIELKFEQSDILRDYASYTI